MNKQHAIAQRQRDFKRWWKVNHHRCRAHLWLVKHTKRIISDYNVAPECYDYCKRITKRYNLSEHKRLHSEDAWFLWRVTHPLECEKLERLESTVQNLREQNAIKKHLKEKDAL